MTDIVAERSGCPAQPRAGLHFLFLNSSVNDMNTVGTFWLAGSVVTAGRGAVERRHGLHGAVGCCLRRAFGPRWRGRGGGVRLV